MTTTKAAQATITADDWTATVTYDGTRRDFRDGGTARNVWTWDVSSTTDAADWMPVRQWSGADLTSAMDVGNPDPIAALCSLGSFLDAYADAVEYADRTGRPAENADLFPGLDVEAAQAIAQAILLDFPEDPVGRPCEGCYADAGEPCRPGCLSQVEDVTP